ncbi:isoprenoid biosynthesis protein [Ventosimonas gracilis]|uniref:Glyoxalase n=1 Tax=Ventosimonas gracilis TaxID=1680762 RepID=A0A139SPC6_9GAMM|nr:isoprenoid biosynthesis glyoxalase ElbB [Ventosimonas gracilis]KXU36406.1 isoprenoid biosynthesis protein [Ventosimonas gracilis]
MSKKIAVLLSGCGVFDGSEIHEAVITLLRLSGRGAQAQCFAPNIAQTEVINHLTGQPMAQSRNVLEESARIARGDIKGLNEANSSTLDALIVPGGFGAAKNLSSFASAGADMQVQADVLAFAQSFAKAGKPIGLICISPTLAAAIYGKDVICTIGNDENTAAALEKMGAKHQPCPVGDIVYDAQHNLVSTPAYMLANSISEAAEGINKLVDKVLELAGHRQ